MTSVNSHLDKHVFFLAFIVMICLSKNMTNNSYADGLTWRMAYYLDPLPLRQFLLTASDHKTMSESPLYQNPYWPMETDKPAEQ